MQNCIIFGAILTFRNIRYETDLRLIFIALMHLVATLIYYYKNYMMDQSLRTQLGEYEFRTKMSYGCMEEMRNLLYVTLHKVTEQLPVIVNKKNFREFLQMVETDMWVLENLKYLYNAETILGQIYTCKVERHKVIEIYQYFLRKFKLLKISRKVEITVEINKYAVESIHMDLNLLYMAILTVLMQLMESEANAFVISISNLNIYYQEEYGNEDELVRNILRIDVVCPNLEPEQNEELLSTVVDHNILLAKMQELVSALGDDLHFDILRSRVGIALLVVNDEEKSLGMIMRETVTSVEDTRNWNDFSMLKQEVENESDTTSTLMGIKKFDVTSIKNYSYKTFNDSSIKSNFKFLDLLQGSQKFRRNSTKSGKIGLGSRLMMGSKATLYSDDFLNSDRNFDKTDAAKKFSDKPSISNSNFLTVRYNDKHENYQKRIEKEASLNSKLELSNSYLKSFNYEYNFKVIKSYALEEEEIHINISTNDLLQNPANVSYNNSKDSLNVNHLNQNISSNISISEQYSSRKPSEKSSHSSQNELRSKSVDDKYNELNYNKTIDFSVNQNNLVNQTSNEFTNNHLKDHNINGYKKESDQDMIKIKNELSGYQYVSKKFDFNVIDRSLKAESLNLGSSHHSEVDLQKSQAEPESEQTGVEERLMTYSQFIVVDYDPTALECSDSFLQINNILPNRVNSTSQCISLMQIMSNDPYFLYKTIVLLVEDQLENEKGSKLIAAVKEEFNKSWISKFKELVFVGLISKLSIEVITGMRKAGAVKIFCKPLTEVIKNQLYNYAGLNLVQAQSLAINELHKKSGKKIIYTRKTIKE